MTRPALFALALMFCASPLVADVIDYETSLTIYIPPGGTGEYFGSSSLYFLIRPDPAQEATGDTDALVQITPDWRWVTGDCVRACGQAGFQAGDTTFGVVTFFMSSDLSPFDEPSFFTSGGSGFGFLVRDSTTLQVVIFGDVDPFDSSVFPDGAVITEGVDVRITGNAEVVPEPRTWLLATAPILALLWKRARRLSEPGWGRGKRTVID